MTFQRIIEIALLLIWFCWGLLRIRQLYDGVLKLGFDQGRRLAAYERFAYRRTKEGDGLRLPLDLEEAMKSAKGFVERRNYPK